MWIKKNRKIRTVYFFCLFSAQFLSNLHFVSDC
nr:MAG TPA: hypothetical protein [Caudoviricetes sp.]